MSRIQFWLKRLATQLWIRPTLMSLAAVAWVCVAWFGDDLSPVEWPVKISKDTLIHLFGILASTMLTVATFSVSAVASAFAAVATSASPRATRIVMRDGGVQGMLASFLATFIYAVVSITALSALDFGDAGRFFLFLAFCVMVGWVLISFLRWVDRVTRLGRLGDTVERIMDMARETFSSAEILRGFGGVETRETPPDSGMEIRAMKCGYLMHVEMEDLQALAEEVEGEIWLRFRPGTLVTPEQALATVTFDGKWPTNGDDRLRAAMTLGNERSAETDPRFCFILLAEIAGRALSPGINDPGSAIGVLASQIELFHKWGETLSETDEDESVKFGAVKVPAILPAELVEDAFTSIARDGAGTIEVAVRLQKTLGSLRQFGGDELSEAAEKFSAVAADLAEQALVSEHHRERLREVVEQEMA